MPTLKDGLLELLPSIPLFGGLPDQTLETLLGLLKPLELARGAVVFRQGDIGREFFLVQSGTVVVYREMSDGHRVRMVKMLRGETFGEMTLLDVQKRSATIEVEEPAVLWKLTNADLYQLYQSDLPGYVFLLQNLCRELSRRLRKANLRLAELADAQSDETTQIKPVPLPPQGR